MITVAATKILIKIYSIAPGDPEAALNTYFSAKTVK